MNLLVKRLKGREFIITDMMATQLSKRKFEELQQINMSKLGDYEFMHASEVDWTWWDRVFKKLTERAIYRTSFRYNISTNKVEEW
jgi:hypothetical protein